MINILFVYDNFTNGGIEKYMLNVIDYIDKSKVNISVLLPNCKFSYEDELLKRNITIFRYQRDDQRVLYKSLCDTVSDNHFDIVHIMVSHLAFSELFVFYALRIKYKYKIIVHSHSTKIEESKNIITKLRHKVTWPIHHILYKFADYKVGCSEMAVLSMFGKGKYQVLNNGIDLKQFAGGGYIPISVKFREFEYRCCCKNIIRKEPILYY